MTPPKPLANPEVQAASPEQPTKMRQSANALSEVNSLRRATGKIDSCLAIDDQSCTLKYLPNLSIERQIDWIGDTEERVAAKILGNGKVDDNSERHRLKDILDCSGDKDIASINRYLAESGLRLSLSFTNREIQGKMLRSPGYDLVGSKSDYRIHVHTLPALVVESNPNNNHLQEHTRRRLRNRR